MDININEHDPTLIRRANIQIEIYECMKEHDGNKEIQKILGDLYKTLMDQTPTADSVDIYDWVESPLYPYGWP